MAGPGRPRITQQGGQSMDGRGTDEGNSASGKLTVFLRSRAARNCIIGINNYQPMYHGEIPGPPDPVGAAANRHVLGGIPALAQGVLGRRELETARFGNGWADGCVPRELSIWGSAPCLVLVWRGGGEKRAAGRVIMRLLEKRTVEMGSGDETDFAIRSIYCASILGWELEVAIVNYHDTGHTFLPS
ncbi:hypothetical protein BT67DRAFT_456292 [Trichocladium antarcticum]|uniref:Uncharacterized protein n=1 Tax=Trichocladium antarcticum TaxID=1450529 RepID=A0AAN6ZE25_9PEZI|nr:hypothetical protein BT67DRAFT_456292 [Trichocladium antarcticum]